MTTTKTENKMTTKIWKIKINNCKILSQYYDNMLYVKKERAKQFCDFLAKTKLNQTIIWETEFEDEDYLFGHFGIDAESDKKDGNTPSIRITTVNVYGY